MRREAAVIGDPVSHSRSPAIFAFLANHLGLDDFHYAAIEVKSAELADVLEGIRAREGFIGVNVTIPHKEAVLRGLQVVSPEARGLGAVNVIHSREGALHGHNTDVIGILKTLEEQGCRVRGRNAWIWGAGGAARAAAYALGSEGAREVYLFNRNLTRAETIAGQMGDVFPGTCFIAVRDLEPILDAGSDRRAGFDPLALVINATPLGMKGAAGSPQEIEATFKALKELPLAKDALAFDLIYNPELTPFLEQARLRRIRAIGGLDMLIHQALATWEIWIASFETDAIRRDLKSALAVHLRGLMGLAPVDDRPVFLTGFMGAGKSTVGTALARRLGWRFVDTDQEIVREAGMAISEIFEKSGEAAFREIEARVVARSAEARSTVVALGGGALTNAGSFETIRAQGRLVYLRAGADFLKKRLLHGAAKRPLLAGLGPEEQEEKIRSLLAVRTPAYERAGIHVELEETSADLIAKKVFEALARENA